MRTHLACARESATTTEAALEWLSGHDPDDGHGAVGAQALDPGSLFTQPVVLAAFAAGADHADQEAAIEQATGQRQLDDAEALMREAAELFRAYEKHHRDIATKTGARTGREEKAERNALMASRLEAWLAGEDRYPVSVNDNPERSNVRPVTSGPLADPVVVEGLLAASGQVDATDPISMATATAFRLETGDPRFDQTRPVCINGFLYQPATEA